MKFLVLFLLASCSTNANIEYWEKKSEEMKNIPKEDRSASKSELDMYRISSEEIKDLSQEDIRRILEANYTPIPDLMKKIALNKHTPTETLKTIISHPYWAFNLDWPCLIHVVNHRNANPEIIDTIIEMRYDFSPLAEFIVKAEASDLKVLTKMYELHGEETDVMEHMIESPFIPESLLRKLSKHKNQYLANLAKYKLSRKHVR